MAKGKFVKFTDAQYDDLRAFVDKYDIAAEVEDIVTDFNDLMKDKKGLPGEFVTAAALYVRNYAKKRQGTALANAFKF